jgi:hypothetical protein
MIIAQRTLRLQQEQGSIDVDVRVFAPQAEKNSWSCRYEIEWPEGRRSGMATGFDSLQALTFALTMIGAEVYTSNYHKSDLLMWTEPRKGYGLPLARNLRDLLIGDDAKFL